MNREREDNLTNPLDLDPITESQFTVYSIIYTYYNTYGIPPSVREIGSQLKEKHKRSNSTGAVQPTLVKLIELGYLIKVGEKGSARSLVPQVDPQEIRIKESKNK